MEKVKETLDKKVWQGGRTLHVGELIVFAIALALIFWKKRDALKSWWVLLALAMLLVAMIIW